MRYYNITKSDLLSGEGFRVVLWVSDYNYYCQTCQNMITWDGYDDFVFDDSTKEELFKELKRDWCSGLTLAGGDSLFLRDKGCLIDLVLDIKRKFPNKTIWCYTKYTWDDLMEQRRNDKDLAIILEHLDVLFDKCLLHNLGRYRYIGGGNSCVIDVQRSLADGQKKFYIVDYNKTLGGDG